MHCVSIFQSVATFAMAEKRKAEPASAEGKRAREDDVSVPWDMQSMPIIAQDTSRRRLRFAVVCSSNMNRSMEGHFVLKCAARSLLLCTYIHAASLESEGSMWSRMDAERKFACPEGRQTSRTSTTSARSHTSKSSRNLLNRTSGCKLSGLMSASTVIATCRYRENGMVAMLERNIGIKRGPEKFSPTRAFDVVITCENRVFETVTQGVHLSADFSIIDDFSSELEEAGSATNEPVHVVNFDIKDNPESATIGAVQILELCQKVRIEDRFRLIKLATSCAA